MRSVGRARIYRLTLVLAGSYNSRDRTVIPPPAVQHCNVQWRWGDPVPDAVELRLGNHPSRDREAIPLPC